MFYLIAILGRARAGSHVTPHWRIVKGISETVTIVISHMKMLKFFNICKL